MNVCVFAQVFLGPNGEVEEYSVISIQQNAAISSDLILDQTEEHLFIMTPNMVSVDTEKQHTVNAVLYPNFPLLYLLMFFLNKLSCKA